jgi:hypothetical protein
MGRLNPEKLHVRIAPGLAAEGSLSPRRYTLTHSDATGDLFLTIGPEHDQEQISGWYTRIMRDEVLAEWREDGDGRWLHVTCHVSGGLVFGGAGMRYDIFQRELPLVLEALRYGDGGLYEAQPDLDRAPIWIHFRSTDRRYNKTERRGTPADYRLASVGPSPTFPS